ncbi:hypothetical protein Tco_0214041 [Tanacetum coccineum]
MAERTMEELLRAPTEGYGEAIVLPEINADHFEIKTNLLQLVQANPFHGYERENPHAHINSFKRITSTLRFRDVPNDGSGTEKPRRQTDKEANKFQGKYRHIPPSVNPFNSGPIFADALLLMPRFAPTIRNLHMNKKKLLELAKIPLNENCSAICSSKSLRKVGDPGKVSYTMQFPGNGCASHPDLSSTYEFILEEIEAYLRRFNFPGKN